jgi:hypothetical protein
MVTPGATYDTRAFARDHRDSAGNEQQLFGGTLKVYADTVMADGARRGQSPRESALRAARGIQFATGISKILFNEDNGYLLF